MKGHPSLADRWVLQEVDEVFGPGDPDAEVEPFTSE
jgi:hypothetical protein